MLISILAGILGDLIFLPALLKAVPWLLQNAEVKAAPGGPSDGELTLEPTRVEIPPIAA